ncbi:MAG: fatty acid desaturase, partial [Silvanigrellaceae bacterium]|nr:fatty acid desaturase [Silvanigrellaceae bacterium]
LRCLYYIFLFFLLSFIGLKLFLIFIVIPFISSYQFLKLFSDIIDHYPLFINKEDNYKTSNHLFSIPLLNTIIFPRNDAYHLIHHLYPRIPTCEFKKLHRILLQEKPYAEKKHSIF